MGKIEINDVDDTVIRGIEARSLANQRSFEDEVRALLSRHALLSPEERVAEADRIRAMTPKGIKQTDSTEIARAVRDGRHIRY
jgi:plasmid stability protein